MLSPTRTRILGVTLSLAFSTVAIAGCSNVEEKLATSPLIGAERIEVSGTGMVQEAMVTGRYVYMRLDSSEPGVWHVVTGKAPKLGDRVTYRGYAQIDNYRSPTLDRSFEKLIIASTKTPNLAQKEY